MQDFTILDGVKILCGDMNFFKEQKILRFLEDLGNTSNICIFTDILKLFI